MAIRGGEPCLRRVFEQEEAVLVAPTTPALGILGNPM